MVHSEPTGLKTLITLSIVRLARLEEYSRLQELVSSLPREDPGLADLGSMFESVGLGEDAKRALVRLGDPKAAIDACIRLNHWDRLVVSGSSASAGHSSYADELMTRAYMTMTTERCDPSDHLCEAKCGSLCGLSTRKSAFNIAT